MSRSVLRNKVTGKIYKMSDKDVRVFGDESRAGKYKDNLVRCSKFTKEDFEILPVTELKNLLQ